MNTSILLGSVLWLIVLGVIVWPFFKRCKNSNTPKYKRCPSCFEEIKQEARVCRFCGKVQEEENKQRGELRKNKAFEGRDRQRDKLF